MIERLISRQPILDRNERVYGFQLIPRLAEGDTWPWLSTEKASEGAAESALDFDEIDEIVEGARAFIPCPRQVLVSGLAGKSPPDRLVLEIRSSREHDAEILAACRRLKDAGFHIALADFQPEREDPLADVVDIIKLDVTASSDRAQWLVIRKYRPRGTIFIAEKVDTRTQFQAALQQGYNYFHGQFYSRPQPYSAGEVTPTKLVYLLVLGAVTRPEISVRQVANAIKHDLALSYKLLRFLNSARFSFHSQVKSIRHAILLLGQNEIRKWIGTVSVAALGEDGPPILVKMALIRAAFCESLAPLAGEPRRQADYFFLGLLSCIDVLMRRPMRVLLAELPIAPDVSAALLGEQGPLQDALRAVVSYEHGHWEECAQTAKKLGLKVEAFRQLYLQAIRWSHELVREEKDGSVEAA